MKARKTRKARGEFSITEGKTKKGAGFWAVSGTKLNGDRVRSRFRTKGEARGFQERLETATENQVDAVQPKRTHLTPDQLRDAEAAVARLPDGKDLVAMVDFYCAHFEEPVKSVPLEDAYQEIIAEKTAANSRPDTVTDYVTRVGGLVRAMPAGALVSDVTTSHVRRLVFKPGLNPVGAKNQRKILRAFFRWAMMKGYCAAVPTDDIEVIRTDDSEPEVLELAEVRRLLLAARVYKDGLMLPYFALQLFGGLRPGEAKEADWRNFDFEDGLLPVRGGTSKKRKRRMVELSDNLIDWLAPYAKTKGPVTRGTNFRNDFEAVKVLAGWRPSHKRRPKEKKGPKWIMDGPRHTAISHHLGKSNHEGKTALWAGNSPDVVQSKYKGLVKPRESAEYWEIRPSNVGGEIIEIKRATA